MERPKAYSYLRFSTAVQGRGDSYKRQAEKAVDYAKENNLDLQVDYTLEDLGVSAYKGLNLSEGALGKFVAACESGAIPKGSWLLVESLDRLSRRDVHDALGPWLRIQEAGIKIVTLADGKVYDRSSQADIYYAIAVMQRAHDESKTKGDRIASAWARKRKEVTTADRKISTHCPGWLRLSEDKKTFIEIPERVALVQRMFESASNGKGAKIICKELNLEGIPPFGRGEAWRQTRKLKDKTTNVEYTREDKWSEAYINKVLKSRAVLGEVQLHKIVDGKRVPEGEPVKDYFPAIISEDVFNAVAVGRRERAIGGGGRRGEGQSNIFTHVTYCGYCGSKMRFKDKGRGHKYLVCNNRFNGSGCDCKPWAYGEFEKSFLTFVRTVDLRGLADGARAKTEARVLSDRIRNMNENLRQTKTRIRDYLIKIENEPTLADIYTERMKELQDETKTLAGDIELTQGNLDELDLAASSISDDELAELISTFQNPTDENRYRLTERIRQLVERIVVYPDGVAKEGVNHKEMGKGSLFDLRPEFRVYFKNGAFQRVILTADDDPEALHVSLLDDADGIKWEHSEDETGNDA